MTQKTLTILGSTGSIGVSALKLVSSFPERFSVVAMSAGKNIDLFAEQIRQHRPKRISVRDPQDLSRLQNLLNQTWAQDIEMLSGEEGVLKVASSPEASLVLSAIVGFAGVKPTLAAIQAGKDIGLANKEAIVAAGPVIIEQAAQKGVRLIPVDSEHSAIYQALHSHVDQQRPLLKRIVLTASGGPFLHHTHEQLANVTAKEALHHPTWNMGAKITIDSATMMNKGLEAIEASRLFGVPVTKIGIQVHPESIIHSMIEYVDGSVLAQLGVTDMRGPLAYAMAYPDRLQEALPSLNLSRLGKLTFLEPDFDRFPCLQLAYDAAEVGGSLPAVLNGANEICVDAFLNGRIGFLDIPRYIREIMKQHQARECKSLDEVCEVDAWARNLAQEKIAGEK